MHGDMIEYSGMVNNEDFERLSRIKSHARSNDRAKRGCTWLNRLIVATAEAVERCSGSKRFYRGEANIKVEMLPTSCLNGSGGLIQRWMGVSKAVDKIPLPDEDEIEYLVYALILLNDSLYDLMECSGEDPLWTEPFSLFDALVKCASKDGDTPENRARLKKEIDEYLWPLAEVEFRLNVTENDIWYKHGDWELPISCAFYEPRKILANVCDALNEYESKHPRAFCEMRTALNGLGKLRENLPMAFVTGEADSPEVRLFAKDVRSSLLLPTGISIVPRPPRRFDDQYEEMSGVEPCEFLTLRRRDLIDRLNTLFQERARCAEDPSVRRKWYEAAAELQTGFSWGQPAYTPEQADRVIALADAAQRESWILRQMKQPENAALEPMPVVTEHEPQPAEDKSDMDKRTALMERIVALLEKKDEGKAVGRGHPKSRAKQERRGATFHGTKTERMQVQLEAFEKFVDKERNDPLARFILNQKNINSLAEEFWKKNRKVLARDAKAKGQKKGYSCAKALATAYRNAHSE